MPGKVILVGAGPGNPGLLTLRGREALMSADTVVYDRLAGKGIIDMIPDTTEKIYVGKKSGYHSINQADINRILLDKALDGKTVVRLKGGDSFVFGRGGEELELLYENNIEFEVVPGVTSAFAVPAYAGIPVTHRGTSSSIHIVTAHTKEGKNPDIDFEKYAGIGGTLVFLMGVSLLRFIVNGLIEAGMDKYTPCAVIQDGTIPSQKKYVGTLSNIEKKAAEAKSPSVIVIGGVCELTERFDWYSKLPLYGKRIVITRHDTRPGGIKDILSKLGADVIECPCIRTEDLVDRNMALRLKREIPKHDIIVFTSASGVRAAMNGIYRVGRDARIFGNSKIAVIGSATEAALEEYGLCADIMPEKFSGKSLGKALTSAAARGGKVLMLRAEQANRDINKVLDESGIEYKEIPLYRTVSECEINLTELIDNESIDYVVFMSGSAVRSFAQFHRNSVLSAFKAVCIGDSTATEAKRYGMECITAHHADIEGIVMAIYDDVPLNG